ncbi:uncharacterized protein STEHIDRAFT_144349 [Stereum hirsutum FP-91666 SS1]|uniref:uncharacterized protein n=1 Tax=Stereum hirsutum (strain FP-91666) TaxID=721885 RepID=UPI000440D265|nr:uncharacterized protein STEHIDRAFT_144349 [Stereum hirsutum FP-91666 SS1]EIM90813.1 hypothetical protein STEHIDRAFT_144349 [Stereum hirsutum FP-91666 SS1]
MLLRFPTELQVFICERATRGTLVALLRTCSHLCLLIKPILYRNVVLDDWRARRVHGKGPNILFTETSIYLFQITVLRTRSFCWEFITSLEIDEQEQIIGWHNLRLILPRLFNLLYLRINSLMWADDDQHGYFLLTYNITPRLREFSSATAVITVSFIDFLEEHPNLTVWRHGFSDSSPPTKLAAPSIPEDILSRFTQYEVMIDDPMRFTVNLRGMINLTHLSIRFYKTQKTATIQELAEAIDVCGRNITFFAFDGHIPSLWLQEQGQERSSSFKWVLVNFVARMPVLRHLQVKDWLEHPRLTSHITALIPATLHTLRVRNSFNRQVALQHGSLERAFQAINILYPFMPSMTTFIYHRHTLFRTDDRAWKLNTSAEDTWTPDWGLESSYFS